MPELPEIASRAREMDRELRGKRIAKIEILQPKCLNMPVDEFSAILTGVEIGRTTYHGKWLFVETTAGFLLLNLGMGGEILLCSRDTLPGKRRLIFDFTDGTCLAINFWWFGYAHYISPTDLPNHAMIARLGPNVLDLSEDQFAARIKTQKGRLKSVLLDQSRFAGIGNAYIHDILFFARLHPLRNIASLTDAEISNLFHGIQAGLVPSLEKGGAFYELDLYGQKGGFPFEAVVIGYREGQPCPVCGTQIEKLKTGSTSSFICPGCQPAQQ